MFKVVEICEVFDILSLNQICMKAHVYSLAFQTHSYIHIHRYRTPIQIQTRTHTDTEKKNFSPTHTRTKTIIQKKTIIPHPFPFQRTNPTCTKKIQAKYSNAHLWLPVHAAKDKFLLVFFFSLFLFKIPKGNSRKCHESPTGRPSPRVQPFPCPGSLWTARLLSFLSPSGRVSPGENKGDFCHPVIISFVLYFF